MDHLDDEQINTLRSLANVLAEHPVVVELEPNEVPSYDKGYRKAMEHAAAKLHAVIDGLAGIRVINELNITDVALVTNPLPGSMTVVMRTEPVVHGPVTVGKVDIPKQEFLTDREKRCMMLTCPATDNLSNHNFDLATGPGVLHCTHCDRTARDILFR